MKMLSDKVSSKQLVGEGRGSGAGSLVAYLLDITHVDPIKYNLQFSRFIRNGPPVGEAFEKPIEGSRKINQVVKLNINSKQVILAPDTSIRVFRDNQEFLIPARSLKAGDKIIEAK